MLQNTNEVINTMTSLQIAEITGKRHSDVLEAIRKMEPAWEKVSQRKFPLADYIDQQGKSRPMYILSKTESLYIATKFNDEARAKLVLRWEQLEMERQQPSLPTTYKDALKQLLLQVEENEELKSENEQQRILLEDREVVIGKQTEELEKAAPKVQYYDNVMQSTTTYTMQQIAKELDMTAIKLYAYLKEKKVMFKQSGIWMLATKYGGKGYTKMRTHTFTRSDGSQGTSSYTVITETGRRFIHEIVSKWLQH